MLGPDGVRCAGLVLEELCNLSYVDFVLVRPSSCPLCLPQIGRFSTKCNMLFQFFFFLISLVGFIHFTTCSMCELDFCSLFLFLMPLTILVMAHVEWLRMCVCVLWMPLEPKEKRLYCFVSSCDMAANPLQIGRHAQIHHWILKMA